MRERARKSLRKGSRCFPSSKAQWPSDSRRAENLGFTLPEPTTSPLLTFSAVNLVWWETGSWKGDLV